jgi:hypothetical protein
MFLQVTLLSEISNDDGTHILSDAMTGAIVNNGKPLLWKISQSLIRWPIQPNPPHQTWNIWKKLLGTFTDVNRRLNTPLVPWTTNCHKQRKWHFIHKEHEVYITNTTPPMVFHAAATRSRHSQTWHQVSRNEVIYDIETTPVIPNQITPTSIITPKIIRNPPTLAAPVANPSNMASVAIQQFGPFEESKISIHYTISSNTLFFTHHSSNTDTRY